MASHPSPVAGLVLATPPPDRPRTTQTKASRNGDSHAGFPQGFLTTRRMNSSSISFLLAFSFWLTSAINRIVKERRDQEGNIHLAATGQRILRRTLT
jgi:hypothetical protein